ncbi:MAG: MCE family protein [Myxococcales bacterium]|nr:MCE family protein [Myxococcales bacterium]
MKGIGAGVKVGITAILIALIGYFSFKFVGKGLKGDEGYEAWALFRDATGLVDKSRVQVAGLTIGEIKGRRLQGNYARVDLRIKPDAELWSNAAIYKRSASLLGEFYLEIDPGTAESLDPLTRTMVANYRMKDCQQATGKENCSQISNVIEAITATDVLAQISETMPVLRDILKDVQRLTQGPLQDIAKDVQAGVAKNAEAAERLLNHIDQIAGDVQKITGGPANQDLRKSMENIREITESVKSLIGSGEGQLNTTGEKIKQQLDNLTVTLAKFNRSLDNVADVTDNVAKGHGTIGRLLKDEAIADDITDITSDASSFVRSLTSLQTIVGIREEVHQNFSGGQGATTFKTYLSLRLQPRPDKYYLIELVDEPRGSHKSSHTYSVTNGTEVNTDTWERGNQFRFSFMFAKRIQVGRYFGLTGRLGIKESSGGFGADVDIAFNDGFWFRGMTLSIDLFDFVSEAYPRLKVLAAIEFFKHVWLIAGLDDLINKNDGNKPAGATCDGSTPGSWCQGGRSVFFGLQLTFNDEDLRSLLLIGGSALGGAGK